MSPFFFFFITPPIRFGGSTPAQNREEQKKADYRALIYTIISLSFLLLLTVGYILYIFTPPSYGYKNFEKLGTIDCYISGVSEENGYVFHMITAESSKVYTTIVTKKRASELDALCKEDPNRENLYRLDVYSTGTENVYVSTYDDLSRKEAWQDYKRALRDNSVSTNFSELVVSSFCAVLLLVGIIIFARWLRRNLRNDKMEKALNSDQTRALASSVSDEGEDRKKEELEDEALLNSIDTTSNSWHK